LCCIGKLTILNGAGDSVEAGKKVRFEAQLSGLPADSLVWLANGERLVMEKPLKRYSITRIHHAFLCGDLRQS
jgi:hypothetical protein